MNRTSLVVLSLCATTLAACGGLKDALTAHVDVVARAGSQELSVTRLADLLGKSKINVPINKEVATLVARDLWVPYQLLGVAAALFAIGFFVPPVSGEPAFLRWIPAARAFWVIRTIASSTSRGAVIIRSASSSTIATT